MKQSTHHNCSMEMVKNRHSPMDQTDYPDPRAAWPFCETNPNDDLELPPLQVLAKNHPLQDDETNPNQRKRGVLKSEDRQNHRGQNHDFATHDFAQTLPSETAPGSRARKSAVPRFCETNPNAKLQLACFQAVMKNSSKQYDETNPNVPHTNEHRMHRGMFCDSCASCASSWLSARWMVAG